MRSSLASAAILFFAICPAARAQTNASSPARMIKPQPVTIRGEATNQKGEPVAGATICAISANGLRPSGADLVFGKTVTDATGAYVLRDVPLPILGPDGGPIKKYSQGDFQVFGTAEGYGFTWHSTQLVRLEQRSANTDTGPNLFYLGEECVADLVFDLPASVEGRLTNDRDEPLAGVKIEFGSVHDPRRPNGLASSYCNYLGPPDAAGDPVKDQFAGMDRLPEASRLVTTDRDGRYRITGLRRETAYFILIDYRPETDPLYVSVGLTTGPKGNVQRRLGYQARLDHQFVVPPGVTLQITAADGTPAQNVTVRAKRRQLLRGGNLATSDATGKAVLHLPADNYTLFIDPPIGAAYLPHEIEVAVTGNPREQTTSVKLEAATVVTLTAVEAETNKPIAGVSFLQESGNGNDRRPLHSQTVIADYPATDAQGELRAFLPPGPLRFVIDKAPPGYEPVRAASELLALAAGGPQAARFEFRKKADAPATEAVTPPDELSALREVLAKQRNLPKSGTFLIRQASLLPFFKPITLTPADVRKLVEGWNQTTMPDFFEVLRKEVPPESFQEARVKVVMDGEKQRNESDYMLLGVSRGTQIQVSNGHENIRYDPANSQASLSASIVGTTRQSFGPSASSFYTLPSIAYSYANRPEITKPQVKRQAGKLLLEREPPTASREVVDEATGFLHHHWSEPRSGSGREIWRFSPRRMDSGLLLAGLVIDCLWQDDKLRMLQVLQLEEARLHIPSPETFVVSAPAGTIIVDSRQRGAQSKVETFNYPVADVVMEANRISEDSRTILPVLKIGQPAPPLTPIAWLNAAGQTPPPDQKGKVMFVDFWGIFCGPCVAELPEVQALANVFAKENFLLIGLHESGCEVAQVAEFARQRGITYQLAIDRRAEDSHFFGATYKAYGVRGIPSCAVIDQQGKLAYLGDFQMAAREAAKLLGKASK